MSITAQGVPYSRAILAARAVVIEFTPVLRHRPSRRAKKRTPQGDGYIAVVIPGMNAIAFTRRRSPSSASLEGWTLDSSLFALFAQHFKLQPLVFGLRQFFLRLRQRSGSLIEFLAILVVEVGSVKMPLLLGAFRLQFWDRLRQGFQRVLFVEVQPALRCWRRRRGSLGFFSVVCRDLRG